MNNKTQAKKQEDTYIKPRAKKVEFFNSDEKIGSAGATTCATCGACIITCSCVCGTCTCT